MTNKTSTCYQSVFKFIEKNVLKLEPDEIITDFERGLRHAIREYFPKTRLRGCWYHYCAALRKRLLKQLGYKLFKSNQQATILKKQLMCLPLLPTGHFNDGYQHIKRKAAEWGLANNFEKFFKYFEKYWFAEVKYFKLTLLISNMFKAMFFRFFC